MKDFELSIISDIALSVDFVGQDHGKNKKLCKNLESYLCANKNDMIINAKHIGSSVNVIYNPTMCPYGKLIKMLEKIIKRLGKGKLDFSQNKKAVDDSQGYDEPSPESGKLTIKLCECKAPLKLVYAKPCDAFSRGGTGELSAADYESAAYANMLAENVGDGLCLEISDSVRLLFDADCVISTVGDSYSLKVGGESIPKNCAAQIDAGDEMEITKTGGGYLYLSVNGVTNMPSGELCASQSICFYDCSENLYNMDLRALPELSKEESCKIRLLPGPYAASYGEHLLEMLYTSDFTVSQESREGITLTGLKLGKSQKQGYAVFSPIGAVYLSDNGEPYITLVDSVPTTHDKFLASVITADLPKLMSAGVGGTVSFAPCTVQNAQRIITEMRKDYIRNYITLNSYVEE